MPTPADTFIDDAAGALQTVYSSAARDANTTGLSFDYLDANAAKYAKERGGELIGTGDNAWSVEQTTRDAANELIEQAVKEGWSGDELARRFDEAGLFSDERAETIARSEIAMAQNYGQCETYAAAGVTRLYVLDGDCDECKEVDGRVCSIAWSLENPIGHPNCVRSFIPAEEDDEIELDV